MTLSEPGSPPPLAYRHGRLEMEGVGLSELLAHRPTPFFLVSERRLVANYQALARGFAAAGVAFTLRYCAKANNEAGVLSVLARQGSSLLASHTAEVELALACGFTGPRIAYQRPGASAAELRQVAAAGVGMLHVFRPEDVDAFAAAAAGAARTLRVSLRLRPAGRSWLAPLASLNARLGLDEAEAVAVARRCRDSGLLRVSGLNVYVGTQQSGLASFDRALRRACGLARSLRGEGLEIEEINLGGGIPLPSLRRVGPRQVWARWFDRLQEGVARVTADGDAVPDPLAISVSGAQAFATAVGRRYRAIAAAAGLDPIPTLAAEPGRAVVGNAALLLSTVTAVHDDWLFLDASRNFLGESPLLFSRRILPLREPSDSTRRFVHLSGSTLNTTDVLDLRRRLPRLQPGDAVAFCDAGAYSISRASRYAGMAPAVLMLGLDGDVREIRRAETAADLHGPMGPAFAAARTGVGVG